MPTVLRFIEPCLPSPTNRPPSGSNWIHEIKHDGYRLMARRDSVGIRLITRRGNDWSDRFPRVVDAVNHLKVRSCLIDGEVVCCDERGLARFDVLRRRRNEVDAFLYAFDLLELDGTDLRREPIERPQARGGRGIGVVGLAHGFAAGKARWSRTHTQDIHTPSDPVRFLA